MHVLTAAEHSYLRPLETMLFSLLLQGGGVQVVHLLTTAPAPDLDRIGRICSGLGADLHVLRPRPMPLEQAPRSIHGIENDATYYRLQAGHLLPEELDRVLYLDADLIVRRSLDEFWELLPEEACLAAATFHNSMRQPEFIARFGGRYFNAGVMNLNLRKWRAEGLGQRCLDFLREHPGRVHYHDQCVLNHVCRPFHEIGITWNFNTVVQPGETATWGLSAEEFAAVARDPAIIHFIGMDKPWLAPEEAATGLAREYFEHRRELDRWLGQGEPPQRQD